MPGLITRIVRIIMQPELEWAVVDRERAGPLRVLAGYLAPLALIGPIAYACALLFAGGEGALHPFAVRDVGSAMRLAAEGFAAQVIGVMITACVVYLLSPLYSAPRDFGAGLRVVVYACTPLWIAGIVLAAPFDRFPLLVVIIVIALMHASFLLYVGLHHVAKVPRRDAAECAAIVSLASLLLFSIVGYVIGTGGIA